MFHFRSCSKSIIVLWQKRILSKASALVYPNFILAKKTDPHAKPVTVHSDIVKLWEQTRITLRNLGAEVSLVDFPVVTKYEDVSVSRKANNVVGAPANWNQVERSLLIAKVWDEFLVHNNDPKLSSLTDVNPKLLFPKPEHYLPDTFIEERNWVQYHRLPELAAEYKNTSIYDLNGLK